MIFDGLPGAGPVAVSKYAILAHIGGTFEGIRRREGDIPFTIDPLLAPAVREHLVVLVHTASWDWISSFIDSSVKYSRWTILEMFADVHILSCDAHQYSEDSLHLRLSGLCVVLILRHHVGIVPKCHDPSTSWLRLIGYQVSWPENSRCFPITPRLLSISSQAMNEDNIGCRVIFMIGDLCAC